MKEDFSTNMPFREFISRFQERVVHSVPADTKVIVISKGDEEMLKRRGRRAWHFPQLADRSYAGYYPGSSAEAIGIVLWTNSDDTLGPSSLFFTALAFLTDKADILAGFCCEHTGRRFATFNLPAVTTATLNVDCLADLFNYWLKGHYFYEPEVAFSRRLFQKARGHAF